MLDLPKKEESLWREVSAGSIYNELSHDIEVDVAIVGGGITGLTSAYLLKQAGLRVAVLEKRSVGAGTTGRTTGKVTSQHNLIYNDLQNRLGQKSARHYGQANQAALDLVDIIVSNEGLVCGWQRDDNYVYTANPDKVELFRREAETAARLGLPASFETAAPLPFDIKGAVKFADQAKIHSQQYVMALASLVDGDGSHVFENSNVTGIRDGRNPRVKTKRAVVTAKDIIVATNVPTLPLAARGGYCMLEYPTESYIVAGKLPSGLKGMYISPDDEHYSLLPVETAGEPLLLIGGEPHVSGVRLRPDARYRRLANYAETRFGIKSITHKWSDRDYLAYDSVPLVGKLYPWSKHLYVATAFMKWGLTNGTVAAMILRDLITGQSNPWAKTFNSNRLRPVKSIPRVAAEHVPFI